MLQDVKLCDTDDGARLPASQLVVASLLWLLSKVTKSRVAGLVHTPRCSYVKGSLNQVSAHLHLIVFTICITFYPLSQFPLSDGFTLILTSDW